MGSRAPSHLEFKISKTFFFFSNSSNSTGTATATITAITAGSGQRGGGNSSGYCTAAFGWVTSARDITCPTTIGAGNESITNAHSIPNTRNVLDLSNDVHKSISAQAKAHTHRLHPCTTH